LQRSRCRRLDTEIQRLVGLNYRRWKGSRKKNQEATLTESNALIDEIPKKNEETGRALVLQDSEVGQLSRDLAQSSELSVVMLRKLVLLEAELQNAQKGFEGQIHELLVQLKEAKMRYKNVKAMFVGQFEQVKEGQELLLAEDKHSRNKIEIQKDVD
jgi:hypothetical protein